MIDELPGSCNDRKTPLGELNWIFTAVTDTIAWNVLEREVFHQLFRQDLLLASLFRNFLLAERIFTSLGSSPVSYPRLPSTAQHPMWEAWDRATDICLSQLALSRHPTPDRPLGSADLVNSLASSNSYFSEQLTAFEVRLVYTWYTWSFILFSQHLFPIYSRLSNISTPWRYGSSTARRISPPPNSFPSFSKSSYHRYIEPERCFSWRGFSIWATLR